MKSHSPLIFVHELNKRVQTSYTAVLCAGKECLQSHTYMTDLWYKHVLHSVCHTQVNWRTLPWMADKYTWWQNHRQDVLIEAGQGRGKRRLLEVYQALCHVSIISFSLTVSLCKGSLSPVFNWWRYSNTEKLSNLGGRASRVPKLPSLIMNLFLFPCPQEQAGAWQSPSRFRNTDG